MVATIALPPSKKWKERHVTFIKVTPPGKLGGVIEIRTAGPKGPAHCDRYALREIHSPTKEGRSFRLTKPGGETFYDVFLAEDYVFDVFDSCDCVGFSQHGHCKHLEALKALLEAGHMDPDCLPSIEE